MCVCVCVSVCVCACVCVASGGRTQCTYRMISMCGEGGEKEREVGGTLNDSCFALQLKGQFTARWGKKH